MMDIDMNNGAQNRCGTEVSTKVFVYDVEFDSFLEYDCGSTRIPVSFSWDPTDSRLLAIHTVPLFSNNQDACNVVGKKTTYQPSKDSDTAEPKKSQEKL